LSIDGDIFVDGDNIDSRQADLVLNATTQEAVVIGSGTPIAEYGGAGDLHITDDLYVGGNVSIEGDITIEGVIFSDEYTGISGTLSVSQDLDIRGKIYDGTDIAVDFADNVSISGSLTVFGTDADMAQYLLVQTKSDVPTVFGGGAYLRVGDAATSSDLDSEDDLLITGELEIDGDATIDSEIHVAQYIRHGDDTDTFLDFTADDLNVNVGGAD